MTNIQKIRTPINLRERKNGSTYQLQAVGQHFSISCCQQIIIESLSRSPNGEPPPMSAFVLKLIQEQSPTCPAGYYPFPQILSCLFYSSKLVPRKRYLKFTNLCTLWYKSLKRLSEYVIWAVFTFQAVQDWFCLSGISGDHVSAVWESYSDPEMMLCELILPL